MCFFIKVCTLAADTQDVKVLVERNVMVNQINQGSTNQANIRLDNTKQQAAETANKQVQVNTATAKATSDSVSITPQAQQLKKLNEKAEQASGVDQKKVDQLKKAIANGEYKIDAEKLADNINKLEFKLFGR